MNDIWRNWFNANHRACNKDSLIEQLHEGQKSENCTAPKARTFTKLVCCCQKQNPESAIHTRIIKFANSIQQCSYRFANGYNRRGWWSESCLRYMVKNHTRTANELQTTLEESEQATRSYCWDSTKGAERQIETCTVEMTCASILGEGKFRTSATNIDVQFLKTVGCHR